MQTSVVCPQTFTSPLSSLLSFCSLIFFNQYINTNLCSNMMPLFHVGGIVRNVFAPLLAGGSLICMPSVDPVLFWDLCDIHNCTWCVFSSIHTSSLLHIFISTFVLLHYFLTLFSTYLSLQLERQGTSRIPVGPGLQSEARMGSISQLLR